MGEGTAVDVVRGAHSSKRAPGGGVVLQLKASEYVGNLIWRLKLSWFRSRLKCCCFKKMVEAAFSQSGDFRKPSGPVGGAGALVPCLSQVSKICNC